MSLRDSSTSARSLSLNQMTSATRPSSMRSPVLPFGPQPHWPDDAPLWTGSCPCQPFSQAGRGKGTADERHLWPEWFRLIRECMPPVVIGEQVASPAGLGWLDAVFADLEGAGYACAAADLCAAGLGAPHLRQRLYFVAVTDGERLERLRVQLRERRPQQAVPEAGRRGAAGIVGNTRESRSGWNAGAVLGTQGQSESERIEPGHLADESEFASAARALADPERNYGTGRPAQPHGWTTVEPDRHGATSGFWNPADWIHCTDGKARPVEPGTFPLAHRATARVGRLRAYGNAIVRPQAQAFLEVVMGIIVSGVI